MGVVPRDAATVILLRRIPGENIRGFEVLMALRNSKSKFVPSSYVFPGGRVDEQDCREDVESVCSGLDSKGALTILDNSSHPRSALGAWVAAIRETFEEVGILFAYHGNKTLLSFAHDGSAERFSSHRIMLHRNEFTFAEMLQREHLTLAADRLHYFSHWITPELSPIRYDTRFFVAEVPDGQKAVHDGEEVTRHVWITPEKALESYWKKQFNMVVPTILTLESLAGFETVADVIESTHNKAIQRVMTRIVLENGDIQEHAPDGRIFKNLV